MTESLLGTARHRAMVRAILEAYADDESILTIGVFGSLARADGDEYSDLDLDATLRVEAIASVGDKIRHLVAHLDTAGFPTLLVTRDGGGGAEIVLTSFDRIDITFHRPEDSKAEVLRDLVLLRGERASLPEQGKPAITPDTVEARLRRLHEKFPISALQVAANLRRGRLWYAITLLEDMRRWVMEIYGLSRGSTLPERYFVKLAEDEVRQALGETLTTYRPDSISAGLLRVIELYRSRCVWLSNGRLAMTPEQETVFDHVVAGLTS
ncbi:MAG TPA: nucleotidyltransferase domain-containing protein [Anaerolineae bacterium]|nr:nucleotidyltransferase domain-containing protein [Anaerolineae bacterium]